MADAAAHAVAWDQAQLRPMLEEHVPGSLLGVNANAICGGQGRGEVFRHSNWCSEAWGGVSWPVHMTDAGKLLHRAFCSNHVAMVPCARIRSVVFRWHQGQRT